MMWYCCGGGGLAGTILLIIFLWHYKNVVLKVCLFILAAVFYVMLTEGIADEIEVHRMSKDLKERFVSAPGNSDSISSLPRFQILERHLARHNQGKIITSGYIEIPPDTVSDNWLIFCRVMKNNDVYNITANINPNNKPSDCEILEKSKIDFRQIAKDIIKETEKK